MRFFYIPSVKRYIFFPAIIIFISSFIIQLTPSFFLQELAVFAKLKAKLGYPITFFPNNTLIALRLLFSMFYAFLGGFIGVLYFKLKHRKSGNTLLFSNSFKSLTGIVFLIIAYSLFHSEKFVINPLVLPKFAVNSDFSKFLAINLGPYFLPKIKIDPVYTNPGTTKNNTPYKPGQTNTYTPPKNNPPKTQTSVPNQNPPKQAPPIRQATAQELYAQLNSYRIRHGKSALIWDSQLGNYAQLRANYYASIGRTDSHAGFLADTSKGLNYKFYFYGLSENAGYGVTGDARYIIDDWFGKSPAHNNAQLSDKWTHVGIGVNGQALDFIFGGGKTDSFHAN